MRQLTRLALLLLVAASAFAQEAAKKTELADFIRANYTKYEYRIPMRDGVRLFTSVYVPKDATPANSYPILLSRTPYSVAPYGIEAYKEAIGPSELFARAKYIVAYQDVRGRMMSQGEFVDMRPHDPQKDSKGDIDESTDTYDTIDWLVKNVQHNNGRVGMWGISYPGFYTSAGMIDAHPALKAASPQAPIADWWIGDDFHHNGAFYLAHNIRFFYTFGRPRPEPTTKWPERLDMGTPDGYAFYQQFIPLSRIDEKLFKGDVGFWKDVVAHPDYDGYWKARSLPQHLRNIKPAVMTVGGWFDAEDLYGALKTYEATEKQSPGAKNMIVMGPWQHGGWSRTAGDRLGNIEFHQKTSEFYQKEVELPFFEHHLKGKPDPKLPEALMFETGTNEWNRFDAWPPKSAVKRQLYLHPGGRLDWTPPPATAPQQTSVFAPMNAEYDEYVSDPAKPVPYTTTITTGMTREHMSDDQRLQTRRPDVLTWVSDVLEDDLTIAGPIVPSLFVSTSGTDSDFVVKLIDVYPNNAPNSDPNPLQIEMGGYEQLVRGEPFRGRYRNSFEKPEAFIPNQVSKLEFVMPDALHTFRAGHRIAVQVQSSWFPLIDVNPQTFVPNIYQAKVEDFRKATQRVYHSPASPSAVSVLVLAD